MQVGGHKVSALAIENVLAAHPSIEEVAVVGVPHPELGDQICAVVAGSASQKVSSADRSHQEHKPVLRRVWLIASCPAPDSPNVETCTADGTVLTGRVCR